MDATVELMVLEMLKKIGQCRFLLSEGVIYHFHTGKREASEGSCHCNGKKGGKEENKPKIYKTFW